MNEHPKGLLVVPQRGKAQVFRLLLVAEHYARELVQAGKGPVEIRSRYTGDVLATYGEEEG
ncbi:MAG: hypothetical protein ACYC6T_08130 [Thermoleophilia bacterium]